MLFGTVKSGLTCTGHLENLCEHGIFMTAIVGGKDKGSYKAELLVPVRDTKEHALDLHIRGVSLDEASIKVVEV